LAYWQVELVLCFDGDVDLVGPDHLDNGDTGFSFEPVGPKRTARLSHIRTAMEKLPQLRAAWRAAPVSSALVFSQVC
jgi:hypothetical protein